MQTPRSNQPPNFPTQVQHQFFHFQPSDPKLIQITTSHLITNTDDLINLPPNTIFQLFYLYTKFIDDDENGYTTAKIVNAFQSVWPEISKTKSMVFWEALPTILNFLLNKTEIVWSIKLFVKRMYFELLCDVLKDSRNGNEFFKSVFKEKKVLGLFLEGGMGHIVDELELFWWVRILAGFDVGFFDLNSVGFS